MEDTSIERAKRPRLGILMLDTRFPRVVGDVGNPTTWPFPVRFGVVEGATPQAVVCDDVTPFIEAFILKGRELVAGGCTGIATTCGFLSLIRPELTAALGVPVAASALEQAPQIQSMLPADQRVGVITISETSLTAAHLCVAGVPDGTPIMGMEGSAFATSILENKETLDVDLSRKELVTTAQGLVDANPDVGAILLECTNMPPYASAISAATGKPIYSIYDYLMWFHAGLAPSVHHC